MPKRITSLSEARFRTAAKKEYQIFDEGGLFLLVTPSGGKLWRFRYLFDKKEKNSLLAPTPK